MVWRRGSFAAKQPYTSPADVYEIFRREFDAAYAEGGIFQLTSASASDRLPFADLDSGRNHPARAVAAEGLIRDTPGRRTVGA
jgi:hypothetical protein